MSKPTVVTPEVQSWRKKYLFLPKWLRDFHAQKDLFKTIHQSMDISKSLPYDEEINWTTAQCYVIDVFLWFMARHGYTLQKTRTKLKFNDLDETLEFWENQRLDSFAKMLENRRLNKSVTTNNAEQS